MCIHCQQNEINGIYNVRVDVSQFELQSLLEQGFTEVVWINKEMACGICQSLNGQTLDLQQFLLETRYEAPIFSHSHVQCLCYLQVKHPNGSVINVDWSGVI